MASVMLSTKTPGSVVTLKESGKAAEFIVACHNYESSRNGTGRTLLVRKTALADRIRWGDVNSETDLHWDGNHAGASYLKTWLEQTYSTRLDESIRRCAGKTKYPCVDVTQSATKPYTAEGSVFILSAAELGNRGLADISATKDGTKLEDAALRALESGGGSPWWTRTAEPFSHKEDGEEMETEHYTRVYLYKQASNGWAIAASGFPDAGQGNTAMIRPCFTVPGNMRVNEADGSLGENHAPWVACALQSGSVRGACSKGFSFSYSVKDADGDTLTVTEKIDEKVLRKFSAKDGQQFTFTLDDSSFATLETDKYHDIAITVSDGEKTGSWTQRFMKSYLRGYRVYAGTLEKSGSGTSVEYKWTVRKCIYDPTCLDDERENIIIDPQLEMEKNQFGTLEFTMPVANCFYNSLVPRRTVISVEEDGVEIWMGYVTEIKKNFKMEKEVYCEGELGFLQDMGLVLEPKEYTAAALFREILAAGAAREWKSFRTGTVSSQFENAKINLKEYGTQYTKVWEALKSILLENVGGILRVRKVRNEATGTWTRWLDYFREESELELTTQCIEFGKNLLDLEYYVKAYDIVNRVTYYGYATKGWWIFATTDRISVTVEDADSVKLYGPIERCYVADGTASTKESLTKAAKEKLNELKLKMDYSFEINALDLRDAGVDAMRLGFLKRARVLSWAHDLNQWALCTKLSIPLDALDEKQFTFGSASESLTGQQATGTGNAKRAVDTLRSVVSYINR